MAHLFQIHADRIIQDVELGVGLFFLLFFFVVLFAVLVAVDLRGLDDVDLHPPQARQNGVQFVGISDTVGQRLIQVVEREVALFLRQLDQLADPALHLRATR